MLVIVLSLSFVGLIFAQGEIISPETYASYYAEAFHGKMTANGEIFDMNAYTAAHRTLPFGTILEVTNLENGKKVVVRINDRGPFVGNRDIDVSKAAAAALDMLSRGVTRVSLKKIDPSNKTALGIPKQTKPAQALAQQESKAKQVYQQEAVKQRQQEVKPQATQQYVPQQTPAQPTQQYVPQQAQVQPTQQYVPQQTQVQPTQQYVPQQTPAQPTQQYVPQQTPVQPRQQYVPQKQKPVQQVIPAREQLPVKKLVYIPTTSIETPGPLWRIQLGAFKRQENAMRLVVELRKIQFEPAFEKGDAYIRVVLYGIRPYDLEKVKSVLKKNGYNDYILRQESW